MEVLLLIIQEVRIRDTELRNSNKKVRETKNGARELML
jgi:hypothetical protein